MDRTAKAPVTPIRQTTQYNCMAASMSMALKAVGVPSEECTTDLVNRVMGARPMKGAAWEQALACAQHYGCRATLTMPSTVEQLKAWTDAGIPIMIAWNPEGRPWSHASVVFDVDDDLNVYVADPNIPNPKQTVRVISEDEFYGKWYEEFPDYLVRRPACAIEREVTDEGIQVMASKISVLVPPKYLKRTSQDGHYQVWFSRVGEKHPYIQDHPSIQVALRYAKKYSTLGGVNQVVIYDSLGNQFKIVKSARMARTVRDNSGREWGPRRGLEGPFLFKGGRVLYYDPREKGGTYYDPTTDMYLSYSESTRVIMAGKKERQQAKDRARSLKLKGQNPKGKKQPKSESQKAQESAAWKSRKEQGQAGMAGAGRGGAHPSKKDKSRRRNRKHKGRPRQALEKAARVDEALIERAAVLLMYMSDRKAAKHLMDKGISRNDAFLAVKAAVIINQDRVAQSTENAALCRAARGRGCKVNKQKWADAVGRVAQDFVQSAARARYPVWEALVPGAEMKGSKEQKALTSFWEWSRGELVEATDLDGALEMAAWDLGYQGRRLSLAPGIELLAKILKVNIKKWYRDGHTTNQQNREASSGGWQTYRGGPIRLTPKELSRSDDGWTIVRRPQSSGGWMVALVDTKTGLTFRDSVILVDDPSRIKAAIRLLLRTLSKSGLGSSMSDASRKRRVPDHRRFSDNQQNREASSGGDRGERSAASTFWTSIGSSGWKHTDDGILAYLSPKTLWDKVRDRNIPTWNDLTDDGEQFADGQIDDGSAQEMVDKWNRQGWWPKPVKTQGWHLMIINRARKKAFEATFKANEERKALTNGEMAAEVIRDNKRPRWMTPTGAPRW